MSEPTPIPDPPSASPSPFRPPPTDPPPRPATLGELFPLRVQAALFVMMLAGLAVVAWNGFRSTAPSPRSKIASTVDLNRADRTELMALEGIGPELADRILAHRTSNGPFQGLADLRKVPGVGPATIEKIKPHITLSWSAEPRSEPEWHQTLRVDLDGPKIKPASAVPPPAAPATLDPNTATLDQLQTLPGIGPKLAQRIVERRRKTPFVEAADLRQVAGIGPKTLDKIKPHLRFGAAGQPSARLQ